MTDRLKGVTVTFEHDIRVDDAMATLSAIEQIKGVLSVEPVVADAASHMASTRIRHELSMRLYELAREFGEGTRGV
jgi:hypothetical protein